jgi:hypothetical protein
MSVLKLPLSVDLEQKVGELVPSITNCSSAIMYRANVIALTITTGVMFPLFTCMHF